MMKLLFKLPTLITLIAAIFCTATTMAQNTNPSYGNENYTPSENPTLILTPKSFRVSPPVRDLPVCDDLCTFDGYITPKDGANTSHDLSPKRKRKLAALNAAGRSSTSIDPKMQMSIGPDNYNVNRAPIVSFEDVSNQSAPPDPSMAVGPNHVVTMQNGVWAVYDKIGTMAPGFPKPLNDPLSGPNHADNAGDPVVMYDREADRWFISQFQLSGNPNLTDNVFLVGISTTPDPTGAYNIYEYELNAGNDYPHYGIWRDSYVTAGNFTGAQKVYTFNRTKMLAGDATAEIVGFSPSSLGVGGFAAPIPVHSEAAGAATGDIKIVFYQDDAFGGIATDHIGLWNIDMDWTNATTINNSTISNKVEIPTAPFDAAIAGGFANIAQPGTNQRIDAIVGAVMNMSHWYSFPTHESILLNWVVEIEDGTQKSGIRWVELRSTNGGNTWTVFQEGTFTDPAAATVAQKESVFMGCISMDSEGNIGLGYTKSGTNTFPSLYYTGRMNGDPLGTMTVPEELVISGTTSITFNDRYGDYGQGVRDPEDDLTFWVTSEYSGDPGGNRSSRVYSFRLAPDILLEINCPLNAFVACGDDTSPAATGTAVAISNCDPNPTITFTDDIQATCGNTQLITRTWTATDSCGNPAATCTQTITVTDATAPTITNCPSDITVFNEMGLCTAVVTYDAVTGSDTCGNVTINQTTGLPSGSAFPVGVTVNEFQVVDDCGNIATCSFTVTVQNSEIPDAICQNITVELDENGMATITTADINGGTGTVCISDNATISIDTFNCANIGDNNVVLTIVDNDGSIDTCTAVVTVEDNAAPVIDCSPFTIELDSTGVATITQEMIENITTENCEIDTITISDTTFNCAMVGDHIVTVTVTDVNGNTSSCDITVTVADSIPPAALCQNIFIELDANGMATIQASDIDNGSFDNCGSINTAVSMSTFTCNNLGNNDVTLTITDANGNTSECTAVVTVTDTILPVAICQNITIELNEDGDTIVVTPEMIDNGSSDNCGITSFTLDNTSFNCSNLGDNEVQLTVTDSSGNQASCSATVTVNPASVAPAAVCQSITVILDENGMASILPQNVSANNSFDNCGYVLTLDRDTFTCDDAGQMIPVMLTVTDAQGLSDSCESLVFVVDNMQPTITCPQETLIIAETAPYTLPDYTTEGLITVNDNCLNQLVVTQDPIAGTQVDEGETQITMTVTDPSGNSISCNFDVFVDPSLGINTAEKLNTLSLYPNPTASKFFLEFNNSITIQSIQLFDIRGRIIKTFNQLQHTIDNGLDISEMSNGNYFVKVNTDQGFKMLQIIKK